MTSTIWYSLVAETQFATELVITGLQRLCSVPPRSRVGETNWNSSDLHYTLHVGLYSYASGLERLCKLAIACNGYVTNGEFPNLRAYSHKIGDMLDTVEALIPIQSGPARRSKHLARPADDLGPEAMRMVERFASGAGRYEHLDSLWNDDTQVSTYDEWTALTARASVTEELHESISVHGAAAYAIRSELTNDGLESASQRVFEDLEAPLYEQSVGVALTLFREVRWVATLLDDATHYTGAGIPILGEVVSPAFICSSAAFVRYNIARISDEEVVVDELHTVYERIRAREEAEDEEVREEIWAD